MKRLIITVICLILVAGTAGADQLLTSPVVKPDVDRFRVREFQVVNNEFPTVRIAVEMGYDSGGFSFIERKQATINNLAIFFTGQDAIRADSVGYFETLPPAYQTNPANKVISEINNGTFGGKTTAVDYIETIVKTLAGL